jgi:hypothetical protein
VRGARPLTRQHFKLLCAQPPCLGRRHPLQDRHHCVLAQTDGTGDEPVGQTVGTSQLDPQNCPRFERNKYGRVGQIVCQIDLCLTGTDPDKPGGQTSTTP